MTISDSDDADDVTRSEPLSFRWRFANRDVVAAIGLPIAKSAKQTVAIERLAAVAYQAHRIDPAREISFGRSKSDYAGMSRYQGEAFTHTTIMAAVDAMTDAGLLEETRARAGSRGWRSTVRATENLAGKIEAAAPQKVVMVYEPVETIRLRNRDKRLVDFRETEFTRVVRHRLAAINEATRAARLELKAGQVIAPNVIRCTKDGGGQVIADMGRDQYHRSFNEKFTLGGRFYGTWWQGVPKKDRAAIHIDGEPTVERDYEAHHARLLYAHAGKQLPAEPFTLPDWPRPIVKTAFYIMVNANDAADAHGAIRLEIIRRGLAGNGAARRTEDLMGLIRRRHSAVQDYFCSGVGLMLQREDSDIAEEIMLSACADGIVTLGIHDSFIAKAQHHDKVRDLMDKALWSKLRQINPEAFPELQPAGDGRPSLVLVMPPGKQLHLFGETATVPAADLASWAHGIMPPTVRAAIRYEVDRRGLRQSEAAEMVGISRPQLANALQGRFGVSEPVAERIKTLLRDAAAA